MMVKCRRWVALSMVIPTACEPDPPRGARGPDSVPPQVIQAPAVLRPHVHSVRLVDSIPWVSYMGADDLGVLRRVEVRSATTVDTIPHVFTDFTPVLVGDSVIVGVRSDSAGNVVGAFHYYARRGQLETLPFPSDLHLGSTDLRFSPDGRHIAYVRVDSLQRAEGVVREWPAGTVVATTLPLRVPEGDVLRGAARWSSPRDFEIFVDPFDNTLNRWVRFRGRLGAPGFLVDTATAQAGVGVPPVEFPI